MKLLDWIPLEKLDWQELSANPSDGAVDLLLANPYKIYFSESAENTNDRMVNRLLSFGDITRIDMWSFCGNPNDLAVDFILKNIDVDECKLAYLCENPNDRIVDFVLKKKPVIRWLSMNPNDRVVDYLLKFPDSNDWDYL
jgi:hypothetical protein